MKYLKKFNEAIRFKEKKKSKNKIEPHYILTYTYMIGDANGETKEKVRISKDNPYLERYYKLLNSLKPLSGHWGVMLESDRIYKYYKEKQITEDDYKFLMRLMFEDNDDDEMVSGSREKYIIAPIEYEIYANEFSEGVRSNSEYSFLVFEGLSLSYIDEDGEKHKMEVD